GEQFAVRKGDWKLVQYDNTGVHLYNLKDDIGESKDLARKHPEVVKELRGGWEKWNAELAKPLWGQGKKEKMQARSGDGGGLALAGERNLWCDGIKPPADRLTLWVEGDGSSRAKR